MVPQMSPVAPRAGALCGALVGACSGLVAAAAHAGAGGTLPSGGAFAALVIVCLTVGAATGAYVSDRSDPGPSTFIVAMFAGQAFGHLALAMTAHHGNHAVLPASTMLVVHVAAAIGLGLLIGVMGHLYMLCATILSWLSLIRIHRGRPSRRPRRSMSDTPGARRSRSGTQMRGPPQAAIPAL
jgi:hypothetical protein